MIGWDIIIVRALHIVAALLWVGWGLSATFILGGMLQKLGAQAGLVTKAWYLYTPFLRVVPISAIVTVLAGIYLYARREAGTLVMGSTNQQIILGIGAVFGLLAWGHGAAIGSMSGKYVKLSQEAGDNPKDEQKAQMQELGQKLARNGRISAALMVIALTFMVLPRYIA